MIKKPMLLLAGVLLAPPVAAHSLSQAIQLALSNNPEVLSAYQGTGVASEQLTQAKSGWLPTVDLAVDVGNEYKDKKDAPATSLAKNISSLTVTQPLYDGGATSAAVARSGEMKHVSFVHLDEVRTSVILKSIEAWYEVYRLQRVIRLTNSNVLVHKKVFMQIKQKVDAGGAGKAELSAAETPWIAAKTALINAQGDYKDAVANYVKIVGVEPTEDLRDGLEITEALLPASLDQATEILLQRNYVLETARANLAAARADHYGSRAGLLPTLDFELQGGRKENDGGAITVDQDYTALLKLNYNLFRGGSDLSHRREMARAMMDSQEQLSLSRRNMEEQLQQFWNGLDVSRKLLQTSQQQLVLAQDNFESAKEQFKLGEGDVMAIIAADDALLQARKSVLEDKIETQLGVYRILSHLGTLLDNLAVAPMQVDDTPLEGVNDDLLLVDTVIDRVDRMIAEGVEIPMFAEAADEVEVVEVDPLSEDSAARPIDEEVAEGAAETAVVTESVAMNEQHSEGYAAMKDTGWVVMNALSETKQAADARALKEARELAQAKQIEEQRLAEEEARRIAQRKAEDRARARAFAHAAKVDRIKRTVNYPKARAAARSEALNGRLNQYSQRLSSYKMRLSRSNQLLDQRRAQLSKMMRARDQRVASHNLQSVKHIKRKEMGKAMLSKRGRAQDGAQARTKQRAFQAMSDRHNRNRASSARAIHLLNKAAAMEKAQRPKAENEVAQQSLEELFGFLNP